MANRFTNGTLNIEFGSKLMDFHFNGTTYEVRCTVHSLERFHDHGLNVDAALGSIVALGKERLDYFANNGSDVAIIDKENHISVIITFEGEENYVQIRIATIIPRSNIFVKAGTKVFCLKNYKGGF